MRIITVTWTGWSVHSLPVHFQSMSAYCVLGTVQHIGTQWGKWHTVMAFLGLASSNMVIRLLLGKHLMRKRGIRISVWHQSVLPSRVHPTVGVVSQRGLAHKYLLQPLLSSSPISRPKAQNSAQKEAVNLNFGILCYFLWFHDSDLVDKSSFEYLKRIQSDWLTGSHSDL